jgi:DNA processing protein
MFYLPPAWVLASSCSGRFDPWPLLEAAGGPEAFGEIADPSVLQEIGFPRESAGRLSRTRPIESPWRVLLAGSDDYPSSLRDLPFAPPVLFVDGHADVLIGGRPAVAIVGARAATSYGRRVAEILAGAVCDAGGVVVSGMAVGIDFAAHEAAFDSGLTVGVAGMGLSAIERPGAVRLRRRIVETGGAVLSEFLPDVPPARFTFPLRNRIIAGLALATVVVEAGHRSGALSTARHALAAGREVLAVPGLLGEGNSEGCLDLIQNGATIVRGSSTVLEAAGLAGKGSRAGASRTLPEYGRLLESALQEGGTVDQLAVRAGLSVVDAIRLLARLETGGWVRREAGQRYRMVVG